MLVEETDGHATASGTAPSQNCLHAMKEITVGPEDGNIATLRKRHARLLPTTAAIKNIE